MTSLAAFLVASLGAVTAAPALLEVGTGVADANIGQVLVMLGMAAVPATPAVLAAVAFSRRPGMRAARRFAVLVALGYGALGLFGAWAGWGTKDNFEGEAYDQWAMLQVIGSVLAVLAVATLVALRLAISASQSGTAGDDGSDPSSRRDPDGPRAMRDSVRPEQRATAMKTAPRSPVPLWLVAVAATAAGAALGVWADWTFPNPVYGVQAILLAGTSLVAAVGVLLRSFGKVGRAFAVSSVALLVGTVGGLVLSPTAIVNASGTMTLRVDRPEPMVVSGVAICEIHTLTDELSVHGDLGEGPPVRPGSIQIYLAAEYYLEDDLARDDGLALTILVENLEPDTGGAEIGATPDSTLDLRRHDTGGTVRFAELLPTREGGGGGPAWLISPALEGTVEWSCADG